MCAAHFAMFFQLTRPELYQVFLSFDIYDYLDRGIYEQADIRNLKTEDQDAFLLTLAKSVFLKVVRCRLEHASAIAKASLMSKCVVVEIKEPETAAPSVSNEDRVTFEEAKATTKLEIRPIRTTQTRFVYLAVPTRTIEPCTTSTRLHPGWSLDQTRIQTSELTKPVRFLPSHLDKPKPTAEPDLTWIMRFPKMIETSLSWSVWREPNSSKAPIIQLSEDLGRMSTLLDQPTDCPGRPAFIQLLTATTPPWPDESGHQPKSHFDQI
ncbi:hypothetical protein F2Q68_00002767 [Brassica cretica]|uniref:Uncharacterized protein n=1 Tax=Brassica cretica TaxID=69181 RepID=A0A8S9J7U0_BRACR|nr:hypothetical protein F2Q68_00002767 [Brassica cretica]